MSDRECSVPGCAHVHDVQCLLMSIASGGTLRVRQHQVNGEWVRSEGDDCWVQVNGEWSREVDERPGMWEELQTTVARLSKSASSSGAVGKASEMPVPYDAQASRVAHRLRNELSTWARLIADQRPDLPLPVDDPPTIARWVAEHVAAVFVTAELSSGVRAVVRDAERVIDQAPDRIFVGRCETPLTEEGRAELAKDPNADVPRCVADVYVRRKDKIEDGKPAKDGDAEEAKSFVSCRACGAIHDVAYRKTWLTQHLSGSLVTAGEAAPYLSWLTGKDIKVDTIHKWRRHRAGCEVEEAGVEEVDEVEAMCACRGRVEVRGNREGRPLYRFDDLRARADEVRTRASKPRKEGSAA